MALERLQRVRKPPGGTASDRGLLEPAEEDLHPAALVDDGRPRRLERLWRIGGEQHRREGRDLGRLARELQRLGDCRKPVAGDALEGAVDVAVGDERDAAAEKGEGGDAGKGEKQLRADAEPARAWALGGLLGGLLGDAEFDHGPLSKNKLLEMRQPPARASVWTGLKAPSGPSTVRKTSAMPRLSSAP